MFSILLTLCLPSEIDTCAERYLFTPEPLTKAQCLAQLGAVPSTIRSYAVSNAACTEIMPEPLEMAEIAPGVFVHQGQVDVAKPQNQGDLANIGFIIGETSVAVIDAGGSAHVGEQLYAAIRTRTALPVSHLILTHMHPDHTLGAPVFKALGAEIIGHAHLGDALANRVETFERNLQDLLGPQGFAGSGIVAPDIGVEDRLELDLGGRKILLQSHPTAHTDNDLTVYDPATGTFWAGDLVFADHTPALDGSIRGWVAVLKTVAAHDGKRLVPGHGPVSLEMPGGVQATLDYLTVLIDETRAAIDKGDSLRTAIEYIGESQRADWQLFDEFNPRNATAAYTELEWE